VDGYSKIGSYIGNGSADGTFVFTGFKPAYILIKNISTTGLWIVWDSARNPQNPANLYYHPHLSDTEYSSGADIDLLSNGFKVRNNSVSGNGNTNTIVYVAFAEKPSRYALAK
jgi:hypothetical protein